MSTASAEFYIEIYNIRSITIVIKRKAFNIIRMKKAVDFVVS